MANLDTSVASFSSSFSQDKGRVLNQKEDLSRKGSVDQPIIELVDYINSLDTYYTTSSCSGRILLFSENTDNNKKGCHWLLTSHSEIELQQLVSSLTSEALRHSSGYVYFKFEAFVIHVACKDIAHAQKMLQCAVSAGFRNSGISIGRKGKHIVGVRSTHSLQAPVAHSQSVLVTNEYLEHLVQIANHRMKENLQRIQRFYETLQKSQIPPNPVKDIKSASRMMAESRSHSHHHKNDIITNESSSDDELHYCITELLSCDND